MRPDVPGKSEELIRRLRRAEIAGQRVALFKPRIDDRFDAADVVSHAGLRMPAVAVGGAGELLARGRGHEVVGIDEVQFFEPAVVGAALELAEAGARVVAAGLDRDFRRLPFGPMPELLAHAEFVDKLQAVCHRCGGPATTTQRLVDGRPAPYGGATVVVPAPPSSTRRAAAAATSPAPTRPGPRRSQPPPDCARRPPPRPHPKRTCPRARHEARPERTCTRAWHGGTAGTDRCAARVPRGRGAGPPPSGTDMCPCLARGHGRSGRVAAPTLSARRLGADRPGRRAVSRGRRRRRRGGRRRARRGRSRARRRRASARARAPGR